MCVCVFVFPSDLFTRRSIVSTETLPFYWKRAVSSIGGGNDDNDNDSDDYTSVASVLDCLNWNYSGQLDIHYTILVCEEDGHQHDQDSTNNQRCLDRCRLGLDGGGGLFSGGDGSHLFRFFLLFLGCP